MTYRQDFDTGFNMKPYIDKKKCIIIRVSVYVIYLDIKQFSFFSPIYFCITARLPARSLYSVIFSTFTISNSFLNIISTTNTARIYHFSNSHHHYFLLLAPYRCFCRVSLSTSIMFVTLFEKPFTTNRPFLTHTHTHTNMTGFYSIYGWAGYILEFTDAYIIQCNKKNTHSVDAKHSLYTNIYKHSHTQMGLHWLTDRAMRHF